MKKEKKHNNKGALGILPAVKYKKGANPSGKEVLIVSLDGVSGFVAAIHAVINRTPKFSAVLCTNEGLLPSLLRIKIARQLCQNKDTSKKRLGKKRSKRF